MAISFFDAIDGNFDIFPIQNTTVSCFNDVCVIDFLGDNLLTDVDEILFRHGNSNISKVEVLTVVQGIINIELCDQNGSLTSNSFCEGCPSDCSLFVEAPADESVDLLPLLLTLSLCELDSSLNATDAPLLSPTLSTTLSPTFSPTPMTTQVVNHADVGNKRALYFLFILLLVLVGCIMLIINNFLKRNRSRKKEEKFIFETTGVVMLKNIKKNKSLNVAKSHLSLDQQTMSTVQSKVTGKMMMPRISVGNDTVSTIKSFLFLQDVNGSQATSVVTCKTTSTYKSNVTRMDEKNFKRVKAVNSPQKKKLLKLSKMIWKKIPKSSSENEYMDDVLASVLPFIERKISKFEDFTELNDFSFDEEPVLDLECFLVRLMQGLNVWYKEDELTLEVGTRCLVLAVLYVDQLKENIKEFRLTVFNAHALFAILMLVAGKFTEDKIITNAYWSEVCGLSLEEVSALELIICFKVGFDFSIATDILSKIMPALSR